jgi:cytochrome c-type biogenesis protein CcmH
MMTFVICAALLVAAILARLFLPLLRAVPKKSATTTDALQTLQAARLAIFRDQLTELEREYTAGLLAASDFAQAKRELEHRLLEEVKTDPASDDPAAMRISGVSGVSSATPVGRKTAFALFLIIPLAAAIGYTLLGNPGALDPQRRQAAAPISAQQIEAMVAQLAAKLKQNPEDTKGWVMLARSYKVLERFSDAAEAYRHANALIEKDPMLLADYAEVLSRINNGDLQGKPSELLKRALALDPDEPQALLLAGAAANQRSDFSAAAEHWSRLLLQLEPGSEAATAVETAIARARERAALTDQTGRR